MYRINDYVIPDIRFRELSYIQQKILIDGIIKYNRSPDFIINRMVNTGVVNPSPNVIRNLIGYCDYILFLNNMIKKRRLRKKKYNKKKKIIDGIKQNINNILRLLGITISDIIYEKSFIDYITNLVSNGQTLIFGDKMTNYNTLLFSDGSGDNNIVQIIADGTIKVKLIENVENVHYLKFDDIDPMKYNLVSKKININDVNNDIIIGNVTLDIKLPPVCRQLVDVASTKSYKIAADLSNIFEMLKPGILDDRSCMYGDNFIKSRYNEKKHKLFESSIFLKILEDTLILYRDQYNIEQGYIIYINKLKLNKGNKVIIIGDIHSSLISFVHILDNMIKTKKYMSDEFILNDGIYLVFLGDIVDRGPYSLELLFIIFKLKLLNKDRIFIIGGNHEGEYTYNYYGLSNEMKHEFSDCGSVIYDKDYDDCTADIDSILKRLPSAVFVKYDGEEKWFQLCHGAFDLKYDRKLKLDDDETTVVLESANRELYNNTQLKWGDFTKYWNDDLTRKDRHEYGMDSILKYLDNNNLYSIISGHQDIVNLAIVKDPDISDTTLNNSIMSQCEYNTLDCIDVAKTTKINMGYIIALVTSTAVKARERNNNVNMLHHTYLILNANDNLEIVAIPK